MPNLRLDRQPLRYALGRMKPQVTAICNKASGEGLTRTKTASDDLPGIASFTLMGWFMIRAITDGSTVQTFWTYGNAAAAANVYFVGLDPSDNQIHGYDSFTYSAAGGAIALNTWYHITAVVSGIGVGLYKIYYNGVNTISLDGINTVPDEKLHCMVSALATEILNGRAACLKVWRRALSARQILEEMYSFIPLVTDGLYSWTPGVSGGSRSLDFSGYGRHWRQIGDLTDEDGPPFLNYYPYVLALPPSLVTLYTINPGGTVVPSGALIRSANTNYVSNITSASSIIRGVLTAYTGQIGANGEPDLGVQTSFSGSITPSASLATVKTILLNISGAITSSGNLIFQVGKVFSGAIVSSGNLIKNVLTAYTGQITPSGEPDLSVQTNLSGSITPSGVMTRFLSKLLDGSVTATGNLIKSIPILFSGVVTATGNLLKMPQIIFSGSITPSSTLSNIRATLINLSGAINGAGNLIKGILTAYTGQIGPNGEPDLGVQTILSGSITPSGVLGLVSSAITLAETLFKGMFRRMLKGMR